MANEQNAVIYPVAEGDDYVEMYAKWLHEDEEQLKPSIICRKIHYSAVSFPHEPHHIKKTVNYVKVRINCSVSLIKTNIFTAVL